MYICMNASMDRAETAHVSSRNHVAGRRVQLRVRLSTNRKRGEAVLCHDTDHGRREEGKAHMQKKKKIPFRSLRGVLDTVARFNLPLPLLPLERAPKGGTLNHVSYWNLLHKILDVAA